MSAEELAKNFDVSDKPLNIVFCPPLQGREAPQGGSMRRSENNITIETPGLAFENASFKIARPVIPKRKTPSIFGNTRTKNDNGSYAIRLSDSTWAHSIPNSREHYASRQEAYDVLYNYQEQANSITGATAVEKANQLQCLTDLLLEELSDQLRAECAERCQIVEFARHYYAAIFTMLQEDGKKCRQKIQELEIHNTSIEENLTKVIDTSTDRVNEAREDCARQIADMKQEMEAKKEEYDTSMKRFLEQKAQLEEHVKALHRVFIEFQSDSVYMTLEELKQKHEQLERKMRNKDNEISKLKGQVQKLQKQLQDSEEQRNMTEQANIDLRQNMQKAISQATRLKRQIELQNLQTGIIPEEEEEDNLEKLVNEQLNQNTQQTQEETTIDTTPKFRRKQTKTSIDPTPYIRVNQKMTKLYDIIQDCIQRASPDEVIQFQETASEELDALLLSCDNSLMVRALESKTDELIRLAEPLETLELGAGTHTVDTSHNKEPRFLQYIRSHISDIPDDGKSTFNVHMAIRQLFQAKYLSDKWHERMGREPLRFPEFVITYYCKDGETIFTALQRSARVWRLAQHAKTAESKLFLKFLKESYTNDELSFFLEIRFALLGLPVIDSEAKSLLNVPFARCKEIMQKTIGVFSPALAGLMAEAEKLVFSDYIDYASFEVIMLKHYRNERRKRKNAVKLMFQSKKFEGSVDFESFVAMVQALGYTGAADSIFDLHREATLLGGGDITLDSLLSAMDNLGMHFFTIDNPLLQSLAHDPVTEMSKKALIVHWDRFGQWFDHFRTPLDYSFDPWMRSMVIRMVNQVAAAFKANAPVPSLFTSYRNLLDFFQFGLSVLARGQGAPMNAPQTERQLLLLENLIDPLLVFVLNPHSPKVDLREVI